LLSGWADRRNSDWGRKEQTIVGSGGRETEGESKKELNDIRGLVLCGGITKRVETTPVPKGRIEGKKKKNYEISAAKNTGSGTIA